MKECGIHICIEWNKIPPPFQFRKTPSMFSFFLERRNTTPQWRLSLELSVQGEKTFLLQVRRKVVKFNA